jgi:aspartyl protease family protein
MIVAGVAIGATVPMKRPDAAVAQPSAAATEEAPVETVIQPNSNGHFVTVAKVDGVPVHFVVDTGADIVALTQDDARAAKVAFDPSRFQVIGRGASGDVYGERVMIDAIVLDGKQVRNVHGVVLAALDISLLGQSYLRNLKSVEMRGDEMRLR